MTLDPWDRALLEALDDPATDAELVTIDALADASGVSKPLLEALAREGLLLPEVETPEPRYDPADAGAVEAGMALIEAGLPLGELLALARAMNDAMQPIATRAVELFANFVRDSVEATAGSEDDAARRLVAAFTTMLPATGRLVEHHFRRLLLADAKRRLTS
jgi:DNA-binding transcriptional MerR regulator